MANAWNYSGWTNLSGDIEDRLAFALVNDQCLTISRSVIVLSDLRWHVEVKGQKLSPTSLSNMPATIECVDTLFTMSRIALSVKEILTKNLMWSLLKVIKFM